MGSVKDVFERVKSQPIQQLNLLGHTYPGQIISVGRSCQSCGAAAFIALPGRGPHVAGLQCVSCGKHGGWLSRHMAQALFGTGTQ
jgi:hypothetical protein